MLGLDEGVPPCCGKCARIGGVYFGMHRWIAGTAALVCVGSLILIFAADSRSQDRRRVRRASSLRALPERVQAPPDNSTTFEKVALGRLLFWDPVLSGGKDVA